MGALLLRRNDADWHAWVEWLHGQGYGHPLPMPENCYIALIPRPYNVRLVLGVVGDRTGLTDGWCYTDAVTAVAALVGWWAEPDLSEPSGWFRHPGSGRRVALTDREHDSRGYLVPLGQTYHRP